MPGAFLLSGVAQWIFTTKIKSHLVLTAATERLGLVRWGHGCDVLGQPLGNLEDDSLVFLSQNIYKF
jgi:hypothetical protein